MFHLVPAYGRDYKNRAAVQADLDKGDVDFEATGITGQGYVTGAELAAQGEKEVMVRYARLANQGLFKVREK